MIVYWSSIVRNGDWEITVDGTNVGIGIQRDVGVGWQGGCNSATLIAEHIAGTGLGIGGHKQEAIEVHITLSSFELRAIRYDGMGDIDIARHVMEFEDTADPCHRDIPFRCLNIYGQ